MLDKQDEWCVTRLNGCEVSVVKGLEHIVLKWFGHILHGVKSVY